MINDIKNDSEARMKRTIEALKVDLTKIRTGRASAGLLDHVMVDFYGSVSPVSQVANISVTDARTLTVTPWDKSMVAAIEKAILTSDLGLNPATSGTNIRVPLPPLTEERRKDMIKIVKSEGEQAKISVRNIRRDANSDLKDLVKDKSISEDDERRASEIIQKITDKYVSDIDALIATKEKDLMEF